MGQNHYKVYCAGPLFNPKEQEEMQTIATELERAGYSVFLPQRDGLELSKFHKLFIDKGIDKNNATEILNMSIFSLDIFKIIDSHGLVLNMNGRVPDEGAMVEAGIAWAHNKILIIFRSDVRSLVLGNCNPLVMGLSDFQYVSAYDEIPKQFDLKFSKVKEDLIMNNNSSFELLKEKGKTISNYLNSNKNIVEVAELIINLFGNRENVKI